MLAWGRTVKPQSPSLWQLDWQTWLVSAQVTHVPALDQGRCISCGSRITELAGRVCGHLGQPPFRGGRWHWWGVGSVAQKWWPGVLLQGWGWSLQLPSPRSDDECPSVPTQNCEDVEGSKLVAFWHGASATCPVGWAAAGAVQPRASSSSGGARRCIGA